MTPELVQNYALMLAALMSGAGILLWGLSQYRRRPPFPPRRWGPGGPRRPIDELRRATDANYSLLGRRDIDGAIEEFVKSEALLQLRLRQEVSAFQQKLASPDAGLLSQLMAYRVSGGGVKATREAEARDEASKGVQPDLDKLGDSLTDKLLGAFNKSIGLPGS